MPPSRSLRSLRSASSLLSALVLSSFLGACGSTPVDGPDNKPPTNQPGGGGNVTPSALSVQAGGPQGLCPGGSAGLSGGATGGTAPYTFAWTAIPECTGCIDDPSSATPHVSPSVPTTFRLTVTDAKGVKSSSEVVVGLFPQPQALSLSDQLIQPGESVTLDGSAATESAQWSCNRPDCAMADPAALQASVTPLKSTTYTFVQTNAQGCSVSSQATVWVDLLMRSSLPQDGEVWPVSSKLMVEFDQPLRADRLTADTVQLADADSGAQIPVTASLGAGGQVLYVVPGTGYAQGHDYTLTLVGAAGGLESDDPILPNRLRENLELTFSTGAADVTAPSIVYELPAPGAVDVVRNAVVLAVFDEPLDPESVSATSFHLTTSAGEVQGTLEYDIASQTATLRPAALLEPGTAYTVVVDGVKDLSGNALQTQWSFTAGSAMDESAPQVVSVSPHDGATDVTVTPKVKVVFSEVIDARTLGGLVVKEALTGAVVPGTVTYSAASATATWVPRHFLEGLTSYEVDVAGVRDLAGNLMASPFQSFFSTRQVLFSDDFESGAGQWLVNGSWATVRNRFYSGHWSLTDSPVGKYASNSSTDVQVLAPIDVSGKSGVTLQWWRRQQSERNADYFTVSYRLDGGSWVDVLNVAGNKPWCDSVLAIDTQGASQLEVRLQFTTNDGKVRDGIYVDDVIVQTP